VFDEFDAALHDLAGACLNCESHWNMPKFGIVEIVHKRVLL
jgi:hypothetical protein